MAVNQVMAGFDFVSDWLSKSMLFHFALIGYKMAHVLFWPISKLEKENH